MSGISVRTFKLAIRQGKGAIFHFRFIHVQIRLDSPSAFVCCVGRWKDPVQSSFHRSSNQSEIFKRPLL